MMKAPKAATASLGLFALATLLPLASLASPAWPVITEERFLGPFSLRPGDVSNKNYHIPFPR